MLTKFPNRVKEVMRKSAKLSDEDHKFLKVLAAESGKTVEGLLAEGIDLLRKKHQKRKPAPLDKP